MIWDTIEAESSQVFVGSFLFTQAPDCELEFFATWNPLNPEI